MLPLLVGFALLTSACSALNLTTTYKKHDSEASGIIRSSGVRSFREINATMSVLTGVSARDQEVVTTYNSISDMLPRKNSSAGFSGPAQVGVFRLASTYCDRLLSNAQLRTTKFPDLDFNDPTVLEADKRAQVVTTFTNTFWGRSSVTSTTKITEFIAASVDSDTAGTPNQRANTGRNQGGINPVFFDVCTAVLASGPVIFH